MVNDELFNVRPKELDCEVKRISQDDIKWLVFLGLKDGEPYELFVGYQTDEFPVPPYLEKGKISFEHDEEKGKIYNFKFTDRHGFEMVIRGLNRIFDRELHNYSITLSYMLRYMKPEVIIHMMEKWKFESDDDIIFKFQKLVIGILSNYIKI